MPLIASATALTCLGSRSVGVLKLEAELVLTDMEGPHEWNGCSEHNQAGARPAIPRERREANLPSLLRYALSTASFTASFASPTAFCALPLACCARPSARILSSSRARPALSLTLPIASFPAPLILSVVLDI